MVGQMTDFTQQEYEDLDDNLAEIIKILTDGLKGEYGFDIITIIAIAGLILNIVRTVYVIWFKDKERYYNKLRNPQLFTRRIIKHFIRSKIEDPELQDIVYNELVEGFNKLSNEELDALLNYSLKK